MSRSWRKLGLLYSPIGKTRHPKLLTHAANPTAVHRHGDVFRIFYSGRDADNRSSVGAVDIDIKTRRVVEEVFDPVFLHGPKSSFYEFGVSPGCVYSIGKQRYVLFMGWQRPSGMHWRGDIGRLVLGDDFSLQLDPRFSVLSIDHVDPISLSYPWVEQLEQPTRSYRMWYGSTLEWEKPGTEMVHVLNTAVSQDGHRWRRLGLGVPYVLGVAQAFSRPTLARLPDGCTRMWFSYRSTFGTTYRIGCAREESDGSWQLDLRDSIVGVSESGWDSEMVEYPCVFQHDGNYYMLYNGNGFGATGFGLAVLDNGRSASEA